jgi:hypothetical protein
MTAPPTKRLAEHAAPLLPPPTTLDNGTSSAVAPLEHTVQIMERILEAAAELHTMQEQSRRLVADSQAARARVRHTMSESKSGRLFNDDAQGLSKPSDLNGPDVPPTRTSDDFDSWARATVRRAAPDYMLDDGRCVRHVLERLHLSLAAELRKAYAMGQRGESLALTEEHSNE